MKADDAYAILRKKIKELEDSGITKDQIYEAVKRYHEEYPIETDKTLSVAGGVADAKVVGDKLATKAIGEGIELFYDQEKNCAGMKLKESGS